MDDNVRILIKCSHCGCEYEYDFPQLIIKQEDPEYANMILNDELFYIKCPDCGYMQWVDVDVAYADIEKNAAIFYCNKQSELAVAQSDIEETLSEYNDDGEDVFIRIVSTQNELREKVLLLENGLDDRVVEVLKLYALDKVRNEGHNQEFEEMRCSVLEDGHLNVDFLGSDPMHLRVKRNLYDRLFETMAPIMDECETPLEVSTEWAVQFDVANRI